MDKIFDQEELYWLDDILPGTQVGRIRRISFARHVHIPKTAEDFNPIVSFRFHQKQKTKNFFFSIQPTFNPLYKSSDNESDLTEKNLPNIVEVGWRSLIA